MPVNAGETYFVRAGGFADEVGTYSLKVQLADSDIGHTLDSPRAFAMDLTGSGLVEAQAVDGLDDVFSVVATQDGLLTITLKNDDRTVPDIRLIEVSPANVLLTQVGANKCIDLVEGGESNSPTSLARPAKTCWTTLIKRS